MAKKRFSEAGLRAARWALAVMLAAPSAARAVPVSPDGGTLPGASVCSTAQTSRCVNLGGAALEDATTHACVCLVTSWVPRQVTNALEGDVGLVPIAGSRGNAVVRAALSTVGQNHRHSVMYYNAGSNIRHSTMFVGDVTPVIPLIGPVHLDADSLRNGTPGFTSIDIDGAYDEGDLDETGLVLKPSSEMLVCPTRTTCYAPRMRFTSAVTTARATSGYYKLSDYTSLDGMSRSYSSSGVGDLRGTHCSGFVRFSFESTGYSIPTVTYSSSVRSAAASAVFSAARAEVTSELSWFEAWYKPNADTNIANQIVNCFAGLDCGSWASDWRGGVGSGDSVSPDNLLPTSFTLRGSGSATWNGATVSAGSTVSNAWGNSSTPFGRVEPQVTAGGYYVETALTTW